MNEPPAESNSMAHGTFTCLSTLRLAVRFSFTLAILLVVGVIAAMTGTHWDRLHPDLLHGFGFAPLHLPEFEWFRLITSALLTDGGIALYAALAMLVLGVGWAEKMYGSWRTALVFWGVHIVTLLTVSLAIAFPLHFLDVAHGSFLVHTRDVGPSAGYYGCLGLVCTTLPRRVRAAVIAAVILVLVARLVCSWGVVLTPKSTLSADAAHLLAFPLGVFLAAAIRPSCQVNERHSGGPPLTSPPTPLLRQK
jgi:Rhomboid family